MAAENIHPSSVMWPSIPLENVAPRFVVVVAFFALRLEQKLNNMGKLSVYISKFTQQDS